MKHTNKLWLIAVLLVVCLGALFACQVTAQYKVSFVVDGQAYGEVQTLDEGSKVVKPVDPTKAATAQYTYTFAGWFAGDKQWDFDTDTVTADVTLTAKFTETINKITVKFVKDDGTEISSGEAEYGTKITEPATIPVKENTAQHTYTFDGWYVGEKKWNFDTDTVTESVTLKATYTSTVNKYVVEFKNGDEVLQSTEVEYGTMPEYKGETPTKAADNTTTYTFSGWSPELKAVDGAATYVAQFTPATRTYTVAFDTDSDYTVENQTVEYDQLLTAPDALGYKIANDKYYDFAGWYNGETEWNFATDKVTADGITLTAHWTEKGGIHNGTYDGSKFNLTQGTDKDAYGDAAYLELGEYANGGFVAVDFVGNVPPQIAFFATGVTNQLKISPVDALLFTSDPVAGSFRMYPSTNMNGAVMALQDSPFTVNKLDSKTHYLYVIGCVKTETSYQITARLYKVQEDGTITLAENGILDKGYSISDGGFSGHSFGAKIVLFGSRHGNVSGTVVVADTLENAIKNYTEVHTHYYKLVEEVAATCTTNGTKAHFTCSGCDKLFALDDNDEYVEVSADSLVIAAGHQYGDLVPSVASTCKDKGHVAYYQCSVCQHYFDETKTEITTIELPLADHTYGEWIAEVPATTEANGTKGHYHCGVCGTNFDSNKTELDTIVIPKVEHTYGTWIAEVAATCHSEGTLGHYHCTHCDKDFDKDYKQIANLIIAKSAHNYGDWTLTMEPTETTTGKAQRVCENEGCTLNDEGHTVEETVAVLADSSVWTLKGVTYTSVYGTVTIKIYKSTYNAETGALTMQKADASKSQPTNANYKEYSDTPFINLGEYKNGGYVALEFSGNVYPQIAFFIEGGAIKTTSPAIGCLMFSSDITSNQYRMFKWTDPNYGAIIAGADSTGKETDISRNKAARSNLTANTNYLLVVGCAKNTRYNIEIAIYQRNTDGTITKLGGYTGNYQLSDPNIDNTGDNIVLFGSRHGNLSAKVTIANTLDEITSQYANPSEPQRTVETHKSTYDATTRRVTLEKCVGDKGYTDCSYVDFGEYANGGQIEIDFAGQYPPQIAFFVSGSTQTLMESAYKCLMFSGDAVGTYFRVYNGTDVPNNPIFTDWTAAGYKNLNANGSYKLVIKCVKTSSAYSIVMTIYSVEGSTLTEIGKSEKGLALTDSRVSDLGTHIVLFGSRNAAINATVTITDSADL